MERGKAAPPPNLLHLAAVSGKQKADLAYLIFHLCEEKVEHLTALSVLRCELICLVDEECPSAGLQKVVQLLLDPWYAFAG
jgi:hypothetical protein